VVLLHCSRGACFVLWLLLFVPCRLNYINDFAPTKHDFKRPPYAIDAGVTKTGTLAAYQPKGAWINPGKRSWLK
jgi:NADH:ubiquinone oxidoreductase subunit